LQTDQVGVLSARFTSPMQAQAIGVHKV